MNLKELLNCPNCKTRLIELNSSLNCLNCNSKYKIESGVYEFINIDKLNPHFNNQIKYFDNDKGNLNTKYSLEFWQSSYLRRFVSHIPNVNEKVILDCGCGSGYMTIELALKGAYVIAIDLSKRCLERLYNIAVTLKIENRIIFVRSFADSLPISDNSVDIFISNAVLEHIPNEKDSISEINRVTSCNASLMLTVPLSYKLLNPILLPLNIIHDKKIGHLRRYNAKIISERFNNWILIKSYYTGHTFKVVKIILNMIFPIFDKEKIEINDEKFSNNKFWASNIISFLKKVKNN